MNKGASQAPLLFSLTFCVKSNGWYQMTQKRVINLLVNPVPRISHKAHAIFIHVNAKFFDYNPLILSLLFISKIK